VTAWRGQPWIRSRRGFTPNVIGGDGSGTFRISGSILTGACPNCGDDMRIVDGVYDLAEGVVTAFRALGRDELERMRDVLASSQSGTIEPARATRTVAAISPDVGALIEAMQNQRQWTAPAIVSTLLAVITVLLAWLALNPHQTLSEADHKALQRDIRTAIEQVVPPSPATRARSPIDAGASRSSRRSPGARGAPAARRG
jgi:hypothetical protein